ncbi:AraC family transcriptional regulator ligand-binding domain-containing protein [uncultured Pseudoteredinibacter sp.]|uniref:AraC family transcriptional regulator n=1 Tax=uncultured Pseudoteredinibacter sp. TaxID=1641701 RepID=UPI0026267F1B|nr:AraC family transcriptional regulator ligand-binding domain-containing protein [uncultured Pseudoteredinibacter sp.]
MTSLSASIPALKQYLTAAEALGVDIAPVLEKHDLTESLLQDNEARIDLAHFEDVFIALINASKHPYFGLYASNHISPAMYASLGLISISAASLRACIELVPTYETLVGDMGTTELIEQEEYFEQRWNCQLKDPVARRHISEAVLSSWYLYGKNMLGLEGDVLGLSFEHSQSKSDLQQYQTVFSCTPDFNAPHTALRLPKEAMDAPLPQANPALQDSLISHANQLLLKLAPKKENSELDEIRRHILVLLNQQDISKAALAKKMNISPRTLQRRLEENGSSYQEELSELRFGLAKTMLKQGVDNESICTQLGFAEPRSFFRRFKQWSGMTTTEFKQTASAKNS